MTENLKKGLNSELENWIKDNFQMSMDDCILSSEIKVDNKLNTSSSSADWLWQDTKPNTGGQINYPSTTFPLNPLNNPLPLGPQIGPYTPQTGINLPPGSVWDLRDEVNVNTFDLLRGSKISEISKLLEQLKDAEGAAQLINELSCLKSRIEALEQQNIKLISVISKLTLFFEKNILEFLTQKDKAE